MEVIFNSCWVLEIQNEVSTNHSGEDTNQIGRSEGLVVTLDKVRCTSAIFKQVCYCSRFALPLQRHHGHMRGQTAKWKLAFTKFDCMKGETVLPLHRQRW